MDREETDPWVHAASWDGALTSTKALSPTITLTQLSSWALFLFMAALIFFLFTNNWPNFSIF